MGPSFAATYIIKKYKDIKEVKVILYGSLALTGRGHLTDFIIKKKFEEKNVKCEVEFDYFTSTDHPNTMDFIISLNDGEVKKERIISIGGGTIKTSESVDDSDEIYKFSKLDDLLLDTNKSNKTLIDYIFDHEDSDLYLYLEKVYETMKKCISNGLSKEGILPGKLKVQRKAKEIYKKANEAKNDFIKIEQLVMASSYAVSEENACGEIVATAPTCGSCGVIPGVITYLEENEFSKEKIIKSLGIAGLIGQIVKTNASVSGALCGCQAEIGTASSMAAAMIMYCFDYDDNKIAQATEIALEHSLGLTCDPIEGYVQIPCIERNAIFALKAINSASLASSIDKSSSKITFDEIVNTMYETGLDLQCGYKETSEKGMSKIKI